MSVTPLKNYRILIADQDRELAEVLSRMLQSMGFPIPYITRSGRDAVSILNSRTFDFLITEWNIQQLDGVQTIKKIRSTSESSCPSLPIIMLTGRAEQSDVMTARDAGVNEFVVKPFSAKMVYNRIERLIEKPRGFVVCQKYVGPDRRHRHASTLKKERRVRVPQMNSSSQTMVSASPTPRIWQADFSLKKKLQGASLQSIITPEVLARAQQAISAITQESIKWVKQDLQDLKFFSEKLAAGDDDKTLITDLCDCALSISSRSGTFGYQRTSEISYMLYLFCRNNLELGNKQHAMLVDKFTQVLFVIASQQLTGDKDKMGMEIIEGLKQLTLKVTQG